MKKIFTIVNLIVVLGLITWNYYVNVYGINGNTVASLSDEYENLFTPADYAFSIWGLIFFGLLGLSIFQVKKVFFDKKDDLFATQIGPWLIIANLGNGLWLDLWLNEMTGTSVFIMIGILVSLIIIIIRTNMQLWEASESVVIWVWWPIALYSGWIAVATIANIAAYLYKLNFESPFSEATWTIIMIVSATAVNLFMVQIRKINIFGAVGIWALVAIAVRHWGNITSLQFTALICSMIIAMSIIGNQLKRSDKPSV